MTHRVLRLLSGLTLLLSLPLCAAGTSGWVTVTPGATDDILTNPGIGVASFHDGYGEHLGLAQYPDAGYEYFRFYWRQLEPQEGQFNFAPIDRVFALAAAHRSAMNVALRIMALDAPESGSMVPDWLIQKGINGSWSANGQTFIPDLSDPRFIRYAQRLMNALGQRYDGNPALAFIDIGLVGSWGEWHNSNFQSQPPLLQRYTTAQLNRYVDMHFSAFPKTPKVMQITGGASLPYAVRRGAGWRADCWGDWHNFSATWSHMRDAYPAALQAASRRDPRFSEAWRHAPVSLEICGYMTQWQTPLNYTRAQVQATFDWALAHHASTINLKSRPVPPAYRDIVDRALLRLGYRFRLAQLRYPKAPQIGQPLRLEARWRNDGVAPIYLRYTLAYRLRDMQQRTVAQGSAPDDIRRWQPGERVSDYALPLPADLPAGRYALETALLDNRGKAQISLANDGRQPDGWYRLTTLTLR
ncbi:MULTISPECIES: DUF4832 domain-containing protein [Edwardsiella]|uniref:DUF4832 domain-containing protein n=1 Tax=Edwardsiella anguillarum TaxID=1821960 RepID=A0ABY8S936_9GAMM|nr:MULTISPECIES: DUF4832 domain-containing protein [Edwardsiella]AKR77929.1 DUF4832 domain-containing protein [Edwardsiella sp. LADL05-105]UOU77626.1 DUF4832 domain-containing protein [Edwardsiella anguillarum]WHP82264.1 DUF4832 domain-containing protein [Edwardsiella anguillarum]WHP86064.1 DUF4832 domain-containing protein [Edwardsiella anguillarum]WHP93658.1 DUF4832 domain-containing protein [Edwardsiella anguillarum]